MQQVAFSAESPPWERCPGEAGWGEPGTLHLARPGPVRAPSATVRAKEKWFSDASSVSPSWSESEIKPTEELERNFS